MLASAADLPYPIIRLIPYGFEMLDERALQRPTRGVAMKSCLARDVQCIENFAVDIKLNLPGRGVSDPDRRRFS